MIGKNIEWKSTVLTTVNAYLVYIKGHPIMSIYILKSIELPQNPPQYPLH